MKYTVGSVPYLNAKPLVRAFEVWGDESPVHVVYEVPSKLPELLAAGAVQAIMVSSIEALRHPGKRVAAGVCIGSQREVLSVRVFSKVPPGEIRTLALDQSSMTSNALAQIVLSQTYGVKPITGPQPPNLVAMLADHDACVLIGDNGMRETGDGLYILDLGLEWFKLTGLPFVWAVWLGEGTLTAELSSHLNAAERWGAANLDQIIAEAPLASGIPAELCERYFREIMHYPMGDRELEGLAEFGRLLTVHGFIPLAHEPVLVEKGTRNWELGTGHIQA
jgi:chorismate dehydratase